MSHLWTVKDGDAKLSGESRLGIQSIYCCFHAKSHSEFVKMVLLPMTLSANTWAASARGPVVGGVSICSLTFEDRAVEPVAGAVANEIRLHPQPLPLPGPCSVIVDATGSCLQVLPSSLLSPTEEFSMMAFDNHLTILL